MIDNCIIEEGATYAIPVSDLAVTTNVEDLTCVICLNICFRPILTTCCEKLICLECTKMMVKHSLKCPYCNEVSYSFEKPSKLVYRLFENLTFYCPKKDEGCQEKIKYYFYFDHIYNSCDLKKQNKAYCKNCQIIYSITTNIVKSTDKCVDTSTCTSEEKSNHDCEKYQEMIANQENSVSELEKRLLELSLRNDTSSSSKSLISALPSGTINIPRLDYLS